MTTASAAPDPATGAAPGARPPHAGASEGTEPAELAVRRLAAVVLYGRPRRAIVAFRALTVLCQFYRETHARIVELSRTGRPAIATAAACALVEATLAYRRYRDGCSPLLRL